MALTYMFTRGRVPYLGSAGCKNLSLREERIAVAMGSECKMRGL